MKKTDRPIAKRNRSVERNAIGGGPILVRAGKVPGFKVNRVVLVKRDDLHSFIEAHKVDPQLPFSDDNDAVVAAALTRLGMKRAG